jgi:4-amino-4-deoxy-L-arabinose transferase-like glycosyltransferase
METVDKRRQKIFLSAFVIFFIALLPRLFLAFCSNAIPAYDASGYDKLAMSILQGRGLSKGREPTSFREPLYPFFLSSIYYLFGHDYTTVRIVQSLLGSFICVIIFLITHRLFDLKTGLLAGLIASVNPSFIKITEYLLSENLYTFILIIAVLFLLQYAQEKKIKHLFFVGATLGIAALTRSIIFLFPLFIILFIGKNLVRGDYKVKKHIPVICVLIFSFILPIFPWTLRNQRIYHKFIPIVSRIGLGLYSSYFPKDGKIFGLTAQDDVVQKANLFKSEAEQNNFLLKETFKFIKNNPVKVLRLELLKVLYFWSPFDWEIIGYGIYNFIYGFIIPFFICGIFITFKRSKELLPVYLPIIYSFLIALITYGSPRLRLPIEPFLIILGAAAINHLYNKAIRKKLFITSVLILFSFNFLFFIYSENLKIFTKSIIKFLGLWG